MNNFTNFMSSGPFVGAGFSLFPLFALGSILFMILFVAIIVLKGYALWTAAQRNEKGWFIALLIINSIGILELVYLYFIVEKGNNKK